MEPSFWTRLIDTIKEIHSRYAAQSTAGFVMGGGLGYAFYFGNVPDTLLHTWIGVWLWVKTLFWAGTTSVVTSVCTKLVDKYFEKRGKRKPPHKKKKVA